MGYPLSAFVPPVIPPLSCALFHLQVHSLNPLSRPPFCRNSFSLRLFPPLFSTAPFFDLSNPGVTSPPFTLFRRHCLDDFFQPLSFGSFNDIRLFCPAPPNSCVRSSSERGSLQCGWSIVLPLRPLRGILRGIRLLRFRIFRFMA